MSSSGGVIDLSVIDTTPGADNVFAPPDGWEGDYRNLMRKRYSSDPQAKQQMFVIGRHVANKSLCDVPEFKGPYSELAATIAAKCR